MHGDVGLTLPLLVRLERLYLSLFDVLYILLNPFGSSDVVSFSANAYWESAQHTSEMAPD